MHITSHQHKQWFKPIYLNDEAKSFLAFTLFFVLYVFIAVASMQILWPTYSFSVTFFTCLNTRLRNRSDCIRKLYILPAKHYPTTPNNYIVPPWFLTACATCNQPTSSSSSSNPNDIWRTNWRHATPIALLPRTIIHKRNSAPLYSGSHCHMPHISSVEYLSVQ